MNKKEREEKETTIFRRSLSAITHDAGLGHACISLLIAIFLQACLDSFVAREKNAGAGYSRAH